MKQTKASSPTPAIQGSLRKWTNYYYGWQPRYFVLDGEFLYYYPSSDRVGDGCKGAVNVSAAEITAHPSDSYRLDVVVPGEAHFHLKASSPHERQEWLVALGTVKSCINSEKASQMLASGDQMRRKQCELRLYCDLLLQQVHSIKTAVVDSPIPDVQKLDENTALLSDTCDTFIRALDECMGAATNPPSPLSVQCMNGAGSSNGRISAYSRHSSDHSQRLSPSATDDALHFDIRPAVNQNGLADDSAASSSAETANDDSASINGRYQRPSSRNHSHTNGDATNGEQTIRTFFGEMAHSFADIRLQENDSGVPTRPFLDACVSLTHIFDVLGSTAFSPVKMDLNGNIRKLTQKYETDLGHFSTLQIIVQSEIDRGTTEKPNSATDALLWLKRGISFLREFIHCFESGEQNLTECANKAYAVTLKKYHSWVVRGIFSLAANAMPARDDFLLSLCYEADKSSITVDDLLKQLRREIVSYVAGIDRCLRALDTFYTQNRLDPDEESATSR